MLSGIGKTQSCQRIAAKKPPPAFLQIEPTGSSRDEDLMDARMLFEPGARLEAVVTGEIIGDRRDLASRIVGFDGGLQSNVALQRCARQHK